jgi:hypothetical protein
MTKFVPAPPKVRTCGECKRAFVDAESFRSHKYKFGLCRSEEGLVANGYRLTDKGWKKPKHKVGKDGNRYVGL